MRLTPKQIEKYNHDNEVKRFIYRRAGGFPYDSSYQKGVLINVSCDGGLCEVCGLRPCGTTFRLHNHEKIFKSAGKKAGGIVSVENSYAICDLCHEILQHHMLKDHEKCIRLLRGHTRNLSVADAERIYTKIKEWAE